MKHVVRYLCYIIFVFCLLVKSLRAQFLAYFEEKIGLNFQQVQFDDGENDSQTYRMFSMPVQLVWQPSRYLSARIRLNQGQHTFINENLFGLGDLLVDFRFLVGSHLMLSGGVSLPTGTKGVSADEFKILSTGNLPIIQNPLKFAKSGLGFNVGASVGIQTGAHAQFALGGKYIYRDAYIPISGGFAYDPSDEIRISFGWFLGNRKKAALTGDAQVSFFTEEKLDDQVYTETSRAYALTAKLYFGHFRALGLFYHRDVAEMIYGTDYQSPDILSGRLGLRLRSFFVPYAGYRRTADGTVIPNTEALVFGFSAEDFSFAGFPMEPFAEIQTGTLGEETDFLGFRLGTDVRFQIY